MPDLMDNCGLFSFQQVAAVLYY